MHIKKKVKLFPSKNNIALNIHTGFSLKRYIYNSFSEKYIIKIEKRCIVPANKQNSRYLESTGKVKTNIDQILIFFGFM